MRGAANIFISIFGQVQQDGIMQCNANQLLQVQQGGRYRRHGTGSWRRVRVEAGESQNSFLGEYVMNNSREEHPTKD